MASSARQMAMKPIEIIVWLDADDPALTDNLRVCREEKILYLLGPRDVIHSSRWDKCLPLATGDLLYHANDDIEFGTPSWDLMIEEEFEKCPDKILMVHGDDLFCQREHFGCHPCVHRRWVDTLGYFIPPYFDGEYGDAWVNDLANRIGRRKFLPFICEHLHYSRVTKETCPACGRSDSTIYVPAGSFCNACGKEFNPGKSKIDDTTREYLARQQKQNPAQIYTEREPERIMDAEKLQERIGKSWR